MSRSCSKSSCTWLRSRLAATYKVEGSKLELRTADGALAATYTRQSGAEAQPAVEAAPEQPGRSPQDTFITLRPTADGVETVTLHLDPNGSVEFASSSSDQAPVMQTGTWKSDGDGTLIVTLTDKDGKKLAKPAVATFKFDGPYLTAVDVRQGGLRREGLKLDQVTDVARKVGPALVTLDLAAGFPLDPTFVSVNGGGEVDASLLGPDCKGFINRNPVVTVNWTGAADLLRGLLLQRQRLDPGRVDAGRQVGVQRQRQRTVARPGPGHQEPDPRQVPHLGGQRGQPAAHPRHPGPDHQAGRQPRHL